jgi:diacylglycerol kinase (ATP)
MIDIYWGSPFAYCTFYLSLFCYTIACFAHLCISTLMKKLIRRFGFALNGWRLFFRTEQNGQIQAVIGVLAIVAGFVFGISAMEWMLLLLCIGLVLGLEMINSVIEKLADHIHPQWHPQIKWVKDAAAGAVLIAALMSAITGCIIFLPKLLQAIHLYAQS